MSGRRKLGHVNINGPNAMVCRRYLAAFRAQRYFVQHDLSYRVVPKYRSVSLLEIQMAKPFWATAHQGLAPFTTWSFNHPRPKSDQGGIFASLQQVSSIKFLSTRNS